MPTIKVDSDTYFVDQNTADDWNRSLQPQGAATTGSNRTWTKLTTSPRDKK
jgi:hypothetical protein